MRSTKLEFVPSASSDLTAPPEPYPYVGTPVWPDTPGTQPQGVPEHACMGLNGCKGADRYGIEGHTDPVTGERVVNECAGQGYCSTTADHHCHVQNACRNQGGCGLYGTAEEMDNPGHNDCSSLGSCATPINAERFSTNGPNKGKSVWARARQVFEEKVWPELREELMAKRDAGEIPNDTPLPEKPGPVPEPFADSGPAFLWISNNDTNPGAMFACGTSGLSGTDG